MEKGHVIERLTPAVAMTRWRRRAARRWSWRECHCWGIAIPQGSSPDRDRLGDLEICHVDDGDVVRHAVCRQKIFFVRGKRHVPDALAHEKIFLNLMCCTVDHGNAVGRTECHESCLAVSGDADSDGLDGLLPQPWYIERDLLLHLMFRRVDDAYRSTDFGRNPDLGGVALELREPGPCIDQHVGDDPAPLGVDEMRHIGRLRCSDEDLTVRTKTHAFRLGADLNLVERDAPFQINYRDGVVVLFGHVKDLAGVILKCPMFRSLTHCAMVSHASNTSTTSLIGPSPFVTRPAMRADVG